MTEITDLANRRNASRRRTILGGRIFDKDGRAWDCRVRDMSATGAKVETEAKLEKGDHVQLKVNKFEDIRAGVVMWIGPDSYGVQFSVKMDEMSEAMRRFFGLMEEEKSAKPAWRRK